MSVSFESFFLRHPAYVFNQTVFGHTSFDQREAIKEKFDQRKRQRGADGPARQFIHPVPSYDPDAADYISKFYQDIQPYISDYLHEIKLVSFQDSTFLKAVDKSGGKLVKEMRRSIQWCNTFVAEFPQEDHGLYETVSTCLFVLLRRLPDLLSSRFPLFHQLIHTDHIWFQPEAVVRS